jgi:hypothetical protein
MYLNLFKDGPGVRAWKGFDWDALGRLYERCYISEPMSKAKSVIVTEEGMKRSEELFVKYFGKAV